jgi:hypothetical protein
MSIDYAWYGATASDIRLAARCNADGDVTLTLSDGRTLTETAATATNDGVVLFAFAATSRLTGTLSQGGTPYAHTMTIKPLSTSSLRVLHWSCSIERKTAAWAYSIMDSMSPDLIICLGDLCYPDATSGTRNGETFTNLKLTAIKDGDSDLYRVHYRSVMKEPSLMLLMSHTPFWYMWDDHEIFDGWCHGLNQMNKKHTTSDPVGSVVQATTLEHLETIYDIARQPFENEMAITNPRNTDAGIDADALYFRVRLGSMVEFVVPDFMTYRDVNFNQVGGVYTEPRTVYARDSTSKSMMYPTQRTWFLDSLTNAEAAGVVHKVLCMTKQVYQHNAGADNNDDAYGGDYYYERDLIVTHVGTLTSAAMISHDSHQPCVYKSVDDGMICINACAMSGSDVHKQGVGYNTNTAWKMWGAEGDPDLMPEGVTRYVFGVIDITPEQQVHTIVDSGHGTSVWGPHRILAGQPATTYHRPKLA